MPTNKLYTFQKENFTISNDKNRLDIGLIHNYLSIQSYWAQNIPVETVKSSIENSLSFGIYDGSKQIGFARIISDFATFAYLADVFILEEYRGNGLSKWLMKCIIEFPELQGLRRWSLATLDAHKLYEQFGFTALANPQNMMEKHNPNVYKH